MVKKGLGVQLTITNMSYEGEKYRSRKEKMKHERGESKRERMMEYSDDYEEMGCEKRECKMGKRKKCK